MNLYVLPWKAALKVLRIVFFSAIEEKEREEVWYFFCVEPGYFGFAL